MKVVQDLIKSIEEKFSILCDKLILADARLPEKETINILQENDLIQVHVRSTNRKTAEKVVDAVTEVLNTEDEERRLRKLAKKKKKMLEEDIKAKSAVAEVESSMTSTTCLLNEEPLQVGTESVLMPDQDAILTPEVTEPKRKRRRRRHKGQHADNSVCEEIVDGCTLAGTKAHTVPFIAAPPSRERKHIHFSNSETDEPDNNGAEVTQKTESVNNRLNGIINGHTKKPPASGDTPNSLTALLSLRSAKFSRTATPVAYNNVPPPTVTASPSTAKPSTPSTSSASIQPPTPVTSATNKSPAGVQDLTRFPVFNGPPRVGDIIAFKVLELSENYNPEISDYFQGRISQVSASGEVTIDLLGEGKAKRHSKGKFELRDPDEDDEEDEGMVVEEYETTVTYNWNELIEPRLIFP